MKYRAVLQFSAVIVVLLITWGISNNLFDIDLAARDIFEEPVEQPKCGLSRACPPDSFALHITSGAATIVGPKICFEGQIIMSTALNNVGMGLNIVVVNGDNGVVEKSAFLNMKSGVTEDILAYLKEIKPGRIVLVGTFDDVTPKLTDEMRKIFVMMGSTLIESLKSKDSWAFAGRAGMRNKSLFEKHAENNAKTNIYEGWPAMVSVSGCFPRNTVTEEP